MRTFKLFPDARQRVEQATPTDYTAADVVAAKLAEKSGGVLLVQAKPGRVGDTEPFQAGPWRKILDGVSDRRDVVSADVVLRDGATELDDRHVEWLSWTIARQRPDLIIAFGAAAAEALLGDKPNTFKVRKCYAHLGDGTPVVCMPSVVGRVGANRFLKRWVSQDIAWAVSYDFPPAPVELVGKSVETIDDAWAAVRDIEARGGAAFDTETFGRMYTDEFKVVQLALSTAGMDFAYHWGPDALDPSSPLVEPLKWLLQRLPVDGHNLKYDVLAMWCHLGVRARHARWCTRLAAKIVRADTSARLGDQSYRVGFGGHKAEAAAAVHTAANIITRLRTAVDEPVETAWERVPYTTASGKARTKKVVTASRPPTDAEKVSRVHEQWAKVRSVNKVKTSWAALTGLPAPTQDWLTAVLGSGEAKSYAYGLIPQDVAERYVCRDTIATAWLVPLVDRELVNGQRHTWDSFMYGVTTALAQIQYNGLPVSVERLQQLASILDRKEMDARRALARFVPTPVDPSEKVDVNWNSTDQLRAILFTPPDRVVKVAGVDVTGCWGLPVVKPTKAGGASTERTVLEELARQTSHPAISPLLELREAVKLQSNYARGMIPFVGPDGRIHCTLTPMGAETGRCSCSGPNLQTIPSRSGLAQAVKSCYVAPAGYKLIQIDYSTLELRVMAFLSGEQSMIDSFVAGRDLHRDTARMISDVVWGNDFDTCGLGYSFYDLIAEVDGDAAVLYDDRDGSVTVGERGWTQAHADAVELAMYGRKLARGEKADPVDRWAALAKEQKARRKVAKVVNFASAYGQGPRSMAEQWGISEDEARNAQNAIMGKRRRLAAWFAKQKQLCRTRGFIDTWWDGLPSTRRWLVDIASNIDAHVGHAERAAGNTPVQGTGSHFCMASLVKLDEWIRRDGIDAEVILSVHDSGLFLVHEDDVQEFVHHAPRIMTQWDSMGCPIVVDVEIGDDWGHLEAA